MSLKSTLRSSDINRAWFWFHFPVEIESISSILLLQSGCQRWNWASAINMQPWGLLKVWGHHHVFFLKSFSSWFFFFLFFFLFSFFVCSGIVSAKEVLKGDYWIGTLLCSLWSWYRSCSPGESQLWSLWCCLFSVLVTLL